MVKKLIFLILFVVFIHSASAADFYNYVYNGSTWVPMLSTDDGQQKLWVELKNCSYGTVQNDLDVWGDVGIGTGSPGGKLEVIGSINATDWTNVSVIESQISDLQTYALESNLYANSTRVDILVLNQWYNSTQQINDNSSLNLKIDALNLNAYGADNLAFTNISETFDENLTITKDLIVTGNSYLGSFVFTENATFPDSITVARIILGAGNFIVDASGNVGIGTLNPSHTFNVIGDGNFTGALYVNGVAVSSGANVSGGGNANYITKFLSSDVIGDSVIYESGDDIVIGGTIASHKFNVIGDANITGTVYAHNFSGNSNISFINSSNDEVLVVEEDGDLNIGNSIIFSLGEVIDNIVDGFVRITGNLNVVGNLSANGANIASGALFVDNSTGNVGIGTTSPSSVLHVVGDVNLSGNVIKPANAAFNAYLSSSQNDIPTSVWTKVAFNAEYFDQGADYDTTNYNFTAPKTGKYQLNLHLNLHSVDSASTDLEVALQTTLHSYYIYYNPSLDLSADGVFPIAYSVLTDMREGDHAWVSVYQGGGTQQMDIPSGYSTSFTGFLAT